MVTGEPMHEVRRTRRGEPGEANLAASGVPECSGCSRQTPGEAVGPARYKPNAYEVIDREPATYPSVTTVGNALAAAAMPAV